MIVQYPSEIVKIKPGPTLAERLGCSPEEARVARVQLARCDLIGLVRSVLGVPLRRGDLVGDWPTATAFGAVWTVERDYDNPRDRATLRFLGRCPDCCGMTWSVGVATLEDYYALRVHFRATSHECVRVVPLSPAVVIRTPVAVGRPS